MDPDAVAEFAACIYGDVGEEVDLIAEYGASADMVAALEHGASADANVLADDAIGTDVGARVNLSRRRDDGCGVNGRGKDGVRKKDRKDFGKGDTSASHFYQDLFCGGKVAVDNDGGRGTF